MTENNGSNFNQNYTRIVVWEYFSKPKFKKQNPKLILHFFPTYLMPIKDHER